MLILSRPATSRGSISHDFRRKQAGLFGSAQTAAQQKGNLRTGPVAGSPEGFVVPIRPLRRKPPRPASVRPAAPLQRAEPIHTTAVAPDPVIAQAKRDIDAGLVDTDMRVTPGLDAKRRAEIVPGAGGKPPSAGR